MSNLNKKYTMKKLILGIAFLSFVAFGALSVQHVVAGSNNIEFVKFDKDPKKDGDKKATESSDAPKAEVKSADAKSGKDCQSSCAGKSASACCDKSKEGCATACPDKK
jgi:uncharacterized protein YxeA